MTYNELFEQVKKKKSFLCVGLDSDIKKLPQHLMGAEDPVYEFMPFVEHGVHMFFSVNGGKFPIDTPLLA